MDYYCKNEDIIVRQSDFDLDQTLDCGQAFRWVKTAQNEYCGIFLNRPLKISCEDSKEGVFCFHDVTENDFLDVWRAYFDFDTDYSEIKRRLSEDETLFKACKFAGGIRLLRQDSWETLTSFIISQNNNIPRIKAIIGRLCEHFGGYPSADRLSGETVESLGFLRAGFRAKYLVDAAQRVSGGDVKLEKIALCQTKKAAAELMRIKGVGPKVADCCLLFGMHKTDAFPKDVWIKRVLENYYPNGLPECTREIEGIAQQYLFHYIRNM